VEAKGDDKVGAKSDVSSQGFIISWISVRFIIPNYFFLYYLLIVF